MISFQQVSKIVVAAGVKRAALSSVDVKIPSDRRVALLGTSDEDRRLVIDLIGGLVLPTAGRVVRKARVSFPIGTLAGFQPDLSVRLNVAHVARLYDADIGSVISFVERVANIGPAFDRPFRELPKPLRQQLAQILGYSIPFDVYLLAAEITKMSRPVRDIAYSLFQERAQTSGMIISTRNLGFAREYCDMALLLHDGGLYAFGRVEDAIGAMEKVQMVAALDQG
jgi:capsular polysaccharide transport system ATP-binding protein